MLKLELNDVSTSTSGQHYKMDEELGLDSGFLFIFILQMHTTA